MQQGGVPSVFAPNPQPYRAPLQGLNPNVFQYDVRTQPLDTSNLIQVMQTKDAMDIKREQAAMERQKIALNKEIKEQELEYKKADMMLDFYAKMLKTTGMTPGADGMPTVDDITTSPRNQKNQAILAEIGALDKQMEDLSVNLFDKQTPQKMIQLTMRRNSLLKSMTSTTEEQAERLAIKNFNDILAGNQKGKAVNPYLFDQTFSVRRDFLAGKDNEYKFGVTLNQAAAMGMVIDEVATKKQFDQLMLDANKAVTVDSPEFVKNGRSNLQRTTTENVFTDSETAAGNIADAVLATPNLRSYFSMKNGINLYDPTKTDIDYRNIIKEIVKPVISLDDAVIRAYKKVTTQSLASDPMPPTVSTVIHKSEKAPELAKKVIEMVYTGIPEKKGVNSTVTFKDERGKGQGEAQSILADVGALMADLKGQKQTNAGIFLKELGRLGVDIEDPIAATLVRDAMSKSPDATTASKVAAMYKAQKEEAERRAKGGIGGQALKDLYETRQDPIGPMRERENPGGVKPKKLGAPAQTTPAKRKWKLN